MCKLELVALQPDMFSTHSVISDMIIFFKFEDDF